MSLPCIRCENSGFLNLKQIPDDILYKLDSHVTILGWCNINDNHDVQVCDCCGDGEAWYGTPGEHYGHDDPRGDSGPYSYNGGLCECN